MKAKNKLGLLFFPAYDWAISPSHPEREERLLYTQDQLIEEGLADIENIEFFDHKKASIEDIRRAHFVIPDEKSIITDAHLVSLGATIRAFELVLSGQVDKSFAMVRPPGHHAFRLVYGDRGFCIVNNEAVALEYIRSKKDLRVAIIDTDAHHGDGTEDIYWNDPNTLFISIHQDGRTLFPGSGFADDLGGPGAYGYNINVPLPPGASDPAFLYVIENLVLPILDDFKPDLVINSAGQDNHYSDPLTHMNLSAKGYGDLNKILDPDIGVLEGGYAIEGALPYVNLALVLAMAGLDYSGVVEPDFKVEKILPKKSTMDYTRSLVDHLLDVWKNKEALADKNFQKGTIVSRRKQIYYDTDNILESQDENIYVCPKCPGYVYINSQTDTGYRVLAINLDKTCCSDCQKSAYDLFENPGGGLDFAYLQDKKNDKYHIKNF